MEYSNDGIYQILNNKIKKEELKIVNGLKSILKSIASGKITFKKELEDIKTLYPDANHHCFCYIIGNNQENIAYPSGLCGERVALFTAGAQFPKEEIESIAIVSPSPLAMPQSFMPCGSCRQVLRETELRQKTPVKIYLQARDEVVLVSKSASNLLPFSFSIQDGFFK